MKTGKAKLPRQAGPTKTRKSTKEELLWNENNLGSITPKALVPLVNTVCSDDYLPKILASAAAKNIRHESE